MKNKMSGSKEKYIFDTTRVLKESFVLNNRLTMHSQKYKLYKVRKRHIGTQWKYF